MKIIVGTTNPIKVAAVKEIVSEYDFLTNVEVVGIPVSSEVSNQPLSLEETIRGAKKRAQAAFQDCDLAVGLESGIFAVPYTKSGYMDTTACAIYDGKEFHLGLYCCFEYPPEVVKLV